MSKPFPSKLIVNISELKKGSFYKVYQHSCKEGQKEYGDYFQCIDIDEKNNLVQIGWCDENGEYDLVKKVNQKYPTYAWGAIAHFCDIYEYDFVSPQLKNIPTYDHKKIRRKSYYYNCWIGITLQYWHLLPFKGFSKSESELWFVCFLCFTFNWQRVDKELVRKKREAQKVLQLTHGGYDN